MKFQKKCDNIIVGWKIISEGNDGGSFKIENRILGTEHYRIKLKNGTLQKSINLTLRIWTSPKEL